MTKKRKIAKNQILLFLGLLLFWIIVSSTLEPYAVILGIVASLLLALYDKDLLSKIDFSHFAGTKWLYYFGIYLLNLIVEVIKSNFQVAKIVLSPKMKINPQVVKAPVKFKSDLYKVMYANTITLTPGTLTIDIGDEGYVVHALTDEAAEGLNSSKLEEYIIKLEGEIR